MGQSVCLYTNGRSWQKDLRRSFCMRFFPFAPSQITDWDWLSRGINSDWPHFKWDRATKQALRILCNRINPSIRSPNLKFQMGARSKRDARLTYRADTHYMELWKP